MLPTGFVQLLSDRTQDRVLKGTTHHGPGLTPSITRYEHALQLDLMETFVFINGGSSLSDYSSLCQVDIKLARSAIAHQSWETWSTFHSLHAAQQTGWKPVQVTPLFQEFCQVSAASRQLAWSKTLQLFSSKSPLQLSFLPPGRTLSFYCLLWQGGA